MKRFPFLLALILCYCNSIVAQEIATEATRLSGRVIAEDGTLISGATVTLANQNLSTTTNPKGEFQLSYLEAGDEELIIDAPGYNGTIEIILIQKDQTNQLGDIRLQPDIALEAKDEVLLNLAESELNDDEGKTQDQASSASSSTDVFNNLIAYAWSTPRYRNRGYTQNYETNYIEDSSNRS